MRVLVLGGAGYVGSFAVRHLTRQGHEVVVVDDLSTGTPRAAPGTPLVVADIRDTALLTRVLREHRAEAVMHFAAAKVPAESMRDPGKYFSTNTAGTLSVVQAMDAAGVHRLIFSSSCAVYGHPAALPVTEDTPTVPGNPYGASKLAAEQILQWFGTARGLRHVSLRYFNAAGADQDGRMGESCRNPTQIVPTVMAVALGQRDSVPVRGRDYPTPDGSAVRDYVHVEDIAVAHGKALDYLAAGGEPAVFNIGTGQGYSVRELIGTAREVSGRPIPVVDAGRRPGDPPAIWADATRCREVLGWKPEHDLHSIISSAWRWHQAHPGGYDDAAR
jgi:UDP-glucose 4-epimerase